MEIIPNTISFHSDYRVYKVGNVWALQLSNPWKEGEHDIIFYDNEEQPLYLLDKLRSGRIEWYQVHDWPWEGSNENRT